MARRPRLPQRNPERLAGWAAAGRSRPLRHLVRSDPARQHRPPRSPHPSRPHPHRPAEARGFDGKRIRVPHNPTGPATTITDMNQTGILLPMSPDKSVNHVPSCTRGLFCHDNGLPPLTTELASAVLLAAYSRPCRCWSLSTPVCRTPCGPRSAPGLFLWRIRNLSCERQVRRPPHGRAGRIVVPQPAVPLHGLADHFGAAIGNVSPPRGSASCPIRQGKPCSTSHRLISPRSPRSTRPLT